MGTVTDVSALVEASWIFAIVMVAIQLVRARRYGPRVKWIPRRWRPRVNNYYRQHGWREPYDAQGNRRSWWRSDD